MTGQFWSEARIVIYCANGWKIGWDKFAEDSDGTWLIDLRDVGPWVNEDGRTRPLTDQDADMIIKDYSEWSADAIGNCKFVLPSGRVVRI